MTGPAPAGEAPPWRLEIAPKGYTVARDDFGVEVAIFPTTARTAPRDVRDFTEAEAIAVRDALNQVASGAPGRDDPRGITIHCQTQEDYDAAVEGLRRWGSNGTRAAQRVADGVGASRGLPAPRCHICGKPATCIGAYEGRSQEQFGCDDCCGHGNEDGHCRPVEQCGLPAAPPEPSIGITESKGTADMLTVADERGIPYAVIAHE